MQTFAVILAAAGKSTRFGDAHTKKVFIDLASKPLWMYAAEAFSRRADVRQVIIVISPEDKELFNEKFSGNAAILGVEAAVGGAERADSVLNGLAKIRNDISMVAIHDAARPCIAEPWIDAVFEKAVETQAAILATPCSSTLKRVANNGTIIETVPRDALWLAQTPQVFDVQLLKRAYAQHPDPSSATDDASIVEAMGHAVSIVSGSPLNIKVTTQADLQFAELALKSLPSNDPFPLL